jgi:cell division protein FtsL
MLACFEYVVQLNEITRRKLTAAYLVEVRTAMANAYRKLILEENTFGQIALEQPI